MKKEQIICYCHPGFAYHPKALGSIDINKKENHQQTVIQLENMFCQLETIIGIENNR